MYLRLFLFFLLGLQAAGASAALYKCEDAQGDVSYSDKPCPKPAQSRSLGHIAKSNSRTGPGEEICRQVQDFGTRVARLMSKGVNSHDVMNHVGGEGAIDAVALHVINYVYSFKAVKYSPGRIGGLTYNKCMGGGFPFPEDGGSGRGSSGTGFVVSQAGHILTNHHVVSGCKKVEIAEGEKRHPAEILARDKEWDLALLKAPLPGKLPVSFRSQPPPELGESVVVAGYPLKGLLASDLQVTTGSISALAGIRNDKRMLQITAPVQPGNSGGPLYDQSGSVIGVIVAKLNTVALARRTGDIAQNINFAINGDLAQRFLRKFDVPFATAGKSAPSSTTEVAAGARQSVLSLVCAK